MEHELEQGDVVLCTVDNIKGTIVFVKIHYKGKELEGSVVLSEIAPGRIRNIRNYVVPKKKIVCKVLRISGDRIDLSLRRVTKKEKEEIIKQHKQEKSYKNILKSILGEESKDLIKKITQEQSIHDFIEKIKENPKELEKLLDKEKTKKILDILSKQKDKKTIIKKEFDLYNQKPNGLEIIKEILGDIKEADIKYISAGKYRIQTEAEDMKKADNLLKEILKRIEERAKKTNTEFQIKNKK